ncbi:uncharacterized protein LOC134234011 [Saccostrea cucullata]|uniref:uncharacterized protein LOC134234011 n=1 Tax=Saccostrea cuccullata TaxID=36930 RepID=UPI002ED5EA97
MTFQNSLSTGFFICGLLCVCSFQSSLTLKAIGSTPQTMCAEDVLILLDHLKECSSYKNKYVNGMNNATHVFFNETYRDIRTCTIPCTIAAIQRGYCYGRLHDKAASRPYKEKKPGFHSFLIHYCCYWYGGYPSSSIRFDIDGDCDYRVYQKTQSRLGETCIYDEQCFPNRLKCSSNSRCVCADGYIEYLFDCIPGLKYGEQCGYSAQCAFYGGVCSINQTCSCKSGHLYDIKEKVCYRGIQKQVEQDKKYYKDKMVYVLFATVGCSFSGLTVGVSVGFVAMFLFQKRRSGQHREITH